VESYVDSAPRAVFLGGASFSLVKEAERIEGLHIALNLRFAINFAWTGLEVINDVVFAQASSADNVHVLNQARLLRARPIYKEQESGADKEAQNGEPDDAI